MVSVKSFMKVFQAFVCLITLSSAAGSNKRVRGDVVSENKVLHNIKYPGPNPRRGYFCYMCNLKLTLLFMWYINACDAFPCGGKNVPRSFGRVSN